MLSFKDSNINVTYRSSSSLKQDRGPLKQDRMYKPPFAGFVDVDLTDGRISLRSLVCIIRIFRIFLVCLCNCNVT